jgi:hypothetical protein
MAQIKNFTILGGPECCPSVMGTVEGEILISDYTAKRLRDSEQYLEV